MTITLNVTLTGEATGYPASNLVARWESDAGLATSGSTVTSWTDQVGSQALAPVDNSPVTTTTPTGAAAILFGNDDGLRKSGVGSLPVGAAARTVALVFYASPNGGAYAGGGWGSASSGRAFTLTASPDASGDILTLDFYDNAAISGPVIEGQWNIAVADYDGTTAQLYLNKVLVAEPVAKSLNTGSTYINLMRSFSGNTNDGRVAAFFVYDAKLSDSDRNQLFDYLSAKYVADTTAPTITSVSLDTPTSASLTARWTSDEVGYTTFVLTTSTTRPDDAEIQNGLDHTGAAAAHASIGYDMVSGANLKVCAPLVAGTTYYMHGIAYDFWGNPQAFSFLDGETPTPSDVTAPVLTTASATKTGTATATGAVTTDEAGGTLYTLVRTSSATPSEVDMLASTRSQSVTATGAQSVSISGLAAGTTYYTHYMHRDVAGNNSNVIAASPATFTTDAAGGGSGQYQTISATYAWGSALKSAIQALSDTSGTTVLAYTGSATTSMDLSNIQFVNRKVVIRPASGTYTASVNADGSYNISSPSDISGTVTGENMQGIKFFRCAFLGLEKLKVGGDCTGSSVEECYFRGPVFDVTAAQSTSFGSAVAPFRPGKTTNYNWITGFEVTNCAFQYSLPPSGFIEWFNPTNCRQEGCVHAWNRNDNWIVQKNVSNFYFVNNWGSMDINKQGSVHTDFLQYAGTGAIDGFYFIGNVLLRGQDVNDNHAGVNGLFIGDDSQPGVPSAQNVYFLQNIVCGTHLNCGLFRTSSVPASNIEASYNDYSRAKITNYADNSDRTQAGDIPVIAGATTGSNNVAYGQDSTKYQANYYFVQDTVSTPEDTDFSLRVTNGDHTGIFTTAGWSMNPLKPPSSSSPRHWNYSGTKKGAYLRLKEIFGDLEVPTDWPRAVIWKRQYDRTNLITSALSGYDSYGNSN